MAYKGFLVKKLRPQLLEKSSDVPTDPGYYRWWFPEDVAKTLLQPLTGGVLPAQVQRKAIDGTEYYLLYFGIAKSLLERINWHVCQHHTPSAVKSGTLSTLRQTISALLQIDESVAENDVNKVLDQCYWEYEVTKSKCIAEEKEEEELSKHFYPLNIQKNIVVPKAYIKELQRLRKVHKK